MEKRTGWLLIGLAATVALYAFTRTKRGQVTVEVITEGIANVARGIRNNNPGNIRHGGSKWQGMAPTQTDSAFVQFTDMFYGVRAVAIILRNYQVKYGLNTLREWVARWAPSNENDTAAYTRYVAQQVGVNEDQEISADDAELMYRVLRAMFRMENGATAALAISDNDVRRGIREAGIV